MENKIMANTPNTADTEKSQTLASKYDPHDVEGKWYDYWMEHHLFHSEPDEREPYTIVIPPPNVTGVLHMGHMLNNTIQDILIRKARLDGKNACWVPGTDHASIATEAKVVAKLAEKGIKKRDIGREKFLEHAWDWTHEYGGIILKQLRRLGASCDWDRTAFTMDEVRSDSVERVFVDLYRKGLIYRGLRMVNWDPKAQTVLSTEEVEYRDEKSHLYYLKYYVADEAENPVKPTRQEGEVLHKDDDGWYAVVATTRPETIMGDTAMCINPKDPKNRWLSGHKVRVPLVNRVIPVIEDRYVDIEFGTGCLKVTPAHDVNDYQLGQTHHLETIDIFNPDATIAPAAGLYVGMDRMDVRKQIAIDLKEAGLMEKVEDYENKVGYSQRNHDTAVEPRLCKQWFLRMKHFADIALPPVLEGKIRFFPQKYVSTYRNWLENIQDWCISRQLWWGHRIPAWFLPTKNEDEEEKFVVALTEDEALAEARRLPGYENIQLSDLRRDEDALDTWFSSWLWPISLFDGIRNPKNKEISYYYPTSVLVTGPDIIFFWVARMIMAGEEYMKDVPFRNVYFTGIVRDEKGRKMSKSLGNSPDPLALIDRYGADGVRMGMMLAAPAGNDILFAESLCEQGRNFCNKIWNAYRLVSGWQTEDAPMPEVNKTAIKWFDAKLKAAIQEQDDLYSKYRLNEALMAVFRLFTDEFSGWYLEMIKPAYGTPIDSATYQQTLAFFRTLMQLIHPFMPFITEELWQQMAEGDNAGSIMVSLLKKDAPTADEIQLTEAFEGVKKVVAGVRAIRNQKNIAQKEPLQLSCLGGNKWQDYNSVIQKMANLQSIETTAEAPSGAAKFMVGTSEFAVPLGNLIDVEAERKKLEAELKHYEGFLQGVRKKLGNEKFVNNAPEAVVALERKKENDALLKIAAVKDALAALK